MSSQRDAERAMLELERHELAQTPIVRNLIGGAIAMGVTYGTGSLVGAAGL